MATGAQFGVVHQLQKFDSNFVTAYMILLQLRAVFYCLSGTRD
jgi:hypothetical protein